MQYSYEGIIDKETINVSEMNGDNTNHSDSVINNIVQLQEKYYNKNNKNFFYKKDQKLDCANMISQQMDINILFEKTLFILHLSSFKTPTPWAEMSEERRTDCASLMRNGVKHGEIYFDYTIFKTYIHPEIFNDFLEYVNNISLQYIDKLSAYTLHLNFQSISISAFERYWPLVRQIMNKFPVTGNKMEKTHIYYTPAIVDQIMKVMNPFIANFRDKIIFYSKTESPEKLSELFSSIRR